jgi:hypothetical protein
MPSARLPACLQASSARKQGGEKDARLQYLSWLIWHMRRRHAKVQHDREAAEEEGARTQSTTAYNSSDEEEEGEFSSLKQQRPGEAGPLSALEAFGKATVTDVSPTPKGAAAPAAVAAAVAAVAAAAPGKSEAGHKPKKLQVKIDEGPALQTGERAAGDGLTARQVCVDCAELCRRLLLLARCCCRCCYCCVLVCLASLLPPFSLPSASAPAVFEDIVGSPTEQTPRAPLEHRFDRLYVVLISLHGLVSGRMLVLLGAGLLTAGARPPPCSAVSRLQGVHGWPVRLLLSTGRLPARLPACLPA